MRRLHSLPSSLLIGLVALVYVQANASLRAHFTVNAILQGTVLDQNGAVVPRARISAENIATGTERTVETDNEGNYQIAALPIGFGRNVIVGPGFTNLDFSLLKNLELNCITTPISASLATRARRASCSVP